MKQIALTLAGGVALVTLSTLGFAQQAAAPYTYATRYNVAGQVTGTIAPDPDEGGTLRYRATRNTYETTGPTAGLLIKTEVGQLSTWASELVEPKDWSDFDIHQTRTFGYDSFGRKNLERVIGSDEATVESEIEYSNDSWDRVEYKTVRMNSHGPDRITHYTYDSYDQVLTEQRALGTVDEQTYVTNEYYGRGVLKSQTDANGNRTELRYYPTSWRLKRRVYPSKTTPGSVNESDYNEYTYDKNGNVTLERKRNTTTITNTFDNNNRLTFKNLSDNTHSGDVSYGYDLRGLTRYACFGSDSTSTCDTSGAGEMNTFDGFGNVKSRKSRMNSVMRELKYQYDLEGNRTRVTHPDGYFFEYKFDGLNRFKELRSSSTASPTSGTNSVLTVTYWPSGGRRLVSRAGSGAPVTTTTPDNALRLYTLQQDFKETSGVATNDLINTFTYNPAGQVESLDQSNLQYNYTDALNRTGIYEPNGLNQYQKVDGQTFAYDASGNLTQDRAADGALTQYAYDMENRLVDVSGAANGDLYYDVLGRLSRVVIGSNNTQFLYDGDALVAEYLNGALANRYAHGDRVDEPLVQYNGTDLSTRRHLFADHQGSVIAHSDTAGNVTQKNAYDPYGVPKQGNEGRFGYTGQSWLKELGLNYYKARIYSPRLGRFLQTDPIFYKDDMNLYAYVGNDPVNRTDPSGTQCVAQTQQCTYDWIWVKKHKDANGNKVAGQFVRLTAEVRSGLSEKQQKKLTDGESRMSNAFRKELTGGRTATIPANPKASDPKAITVTGAGIASRLSGVELKASFDRHWGKNGGWTRASAAGDGSSITTWGKFFSSSDTAQEESFAHETLHLDGDLREQWGNDPAHTDLFNDAAKELLK